MNKFRFFSMSLSAIAIVYLLFTQCAGGFESDSPNAPDLEDAVFGSDSGRDTDQ